MRILPFLLALGLSVQVWAQVDNDSLSLVLQARQALWTAVDATGRAYDQVMDLEHYADEPLSDQLRRVRRRVYQAALRAERARVLVEVLASLRASRGDTYVLCAGEGEARSHLNWLISASDDLVELDEESFSTAEPFDPGQLRDILEERLIPLRRLYVQQVRRSVDACADEVFKMEPKPHPLNQASPEEP